MTDLEKAQAEVPSWSLAEGEVGCVAFSPTFALDGVTITASDPFELVSRVRTFERVIAIALERAGRLDPAHEVGGVLVRRTGLAPVGDGRPVSRVQGPQEAPGAPDPAPTPAAAPEGPVGRVTAIASGYTGETCGECQGIRMRRNGTCMLCEDCGATTGCS